MPEDRYRPLKFGETIRAGDEMLTIDFDRTATWKAVNQGLIGMPAYSVYSAFGPRPGNRRPVSAHERLKRMMESADD